jgi:hypothetical protein
MPTFAVFKNRNFVGYVSAVSERQAKNRALGLHGRCEVVACGNASIDRAARLPVADSSFTHGRAPYPTPGFAERRAALIAAHKASA